MARLPMPRELSAYSDSDHAGCRDSRRSTSAHALFFGSHCLRIGSGTQRLVATSSAEAELYAGTRAASCVIGATRVYGDLGVPLAAPRLFLDATGGLGMAGRRGCGPVKHLATASLWLQDAVFEGRLVLAKVASADNVADAGTKPLTGPVLARLVKLLGYELRHERAHEALQSTGAAAAGLGPA